MRITSQRPTAVSCSVVSWRKCLIIMYGPIHSSVSIVQLWPAQSFAKRITCHYNRPRSVGNFLQSAPNTVRDRSCMPCSNLGRHFSTLLYPPARLCFVSLFLSVCSLVCLLTGLLRKITDYFCVKFMAGRGCGRPYDTKQCVRVLQIGIFFSVNVT